MFFNFFDTFKLFRADFAVRNIRQMDFSDVYSQSVFPAKCSTTSVTLEGTHLIDVHLMEMSCQSILSGSGKGTLATFKHSRSEVN